MDFDGILAIGGAEVKFKTERIRVPMAINAGSTGHLTPEEQEIFEMGNEVRVPLQLSCGNYCFHLSMWYATGNVPELPEWPKWTPAIKDYMAEFPHEVRLERTTEDSVLDLCDLESLTAGISCLVQLYDIITKTGHWIYVRDGDSIFDPGPRRDDIAMAAWVRLFSERYRIRRIIMLLVENGAA